MNKYVILMTFILIAGCGYGEAQKKQIEPVGARSTDGNQEMTKVWNHFLVTLTSSNKVDFQKVTDTKIRCYSCLENTENKRNEMHTLRTTDDNFYEKIYDDLIYIPVQRFIDEDFDLMFGVEFVKILRMKESVFVADDSGERFMVVVTTAEPTSDFEGMQHVFGFRKIDGKWLFDDLDTVP